MAARETRAEFSGSRTKTVSFNRAELNRILQLYSQRVADGEWRDYAIAMQPGRAVFAVFRSSFDKPLYTIAKLEGWGYEVASGLRKLSRAETLEEALSIFDKNLRLVH